MDRNASCLSPIVSNLLNKVRTINTNNIDKTNRALVALYYWEELEENLESICINALMKLQIMFHKDDNNTHAGITKLGSSITAIGQIFTRTMGLTYVENHETQFKDNVVFGGVLLETLQDLGFITIDRNDPASSNKSNRAPLIVHATDRWADVGEIVITNIVKAFVGISFDKPEDVSSLFDNKKSNRPLIKRTTSHSLFNQIIDTPFLKGVNGMQQTGWRVNRDVLKVITEYEWDNSYEPIPLDGNKKDVDDAFKELQAESLKHSKGKDNTYIDTQQKYETLAALWAKKKHAQKERSRIIERQITVAKAVALSEEPVFYYRVEADYRGRLYYAESFFNYQSNDNAKGLLEFSEGKLVSPEGFKWLLIHAAASYNYSFSSEELRFMSGFQYDYMAKILEDGVDTIAVDKLALCDRAKWSEDNISFIRRVASEGIIDTTAEKPMIFLAVCIDIDKYLKAKEKGEDYYSHLPVPVDGSNNGNQHSAAINRDYATGSMVGLTDDPLPKDLYVQVGQKMVDLQPKFFESRQMPMKDIRKNISKRSTMVR